MTARTHGLARRLISTFVLAWLLAVPFHFHPLSQTAELGRFCACIHGLRSELPESQLVTLESPRSWVSYVFAEPASLVYFAPSSRPTGRAPPA